MKKCIPIYLLLVFLSLQAVAQEYTGALYYHPADSQRSSYRNTNRAAAKGTALSLPFFEDFTYDTFYPDSNKWVDKKVYINNNMGQNPISWGVATFDAIDENGLPYELVSKGLIRYADSLTSKPLDLSSYSIADSLYFSFFYQPQGNGFAPQPEDSLMLYFRKASTSTPWTRVWKMPGSDLQPFQQVMIPLDDAKFFHTDFQFRFVNKASIDNADDHWHIDYIRLDANRTFQDTVITDIAYTVNPSSLLNDYRFMPYHQYTANANGERAAQISAAIRNNGTASTNINYGYVANEIVNGTPLSNGTNSVTIGPDTEGYVSFPAYTNTVTAPAKNEPVTFENKFYLQQASGTGSTGNDTIVSRQYFYNYLAYDDGTAEKSYYLKLFNTLPGKIAIEHRLNEADTLRGIGIYFGRQVPLAYQKYFSVAVYRDIAYGGGSDDVIYQEDFLVPGYLQQNGFWYYKFQQPVALPSGKFYLGTIQPALGASDSLYFGLDVSRTTTNHVYYNVLNEWKQSDIQGAVMMRPLFGNFWPSIVTGPIGNIRHDWKILPNPATDKVRFDINSESDNVEYVLCDMRGRLLKRGKVDKAGWVYIGDLVPGIYTAHLMVDGMPTMPQKIIKL